MDRRITTDLTDFSFDLKEMMMFGIQMAANQPYDLGSSNTSSGTQTPVGSSSADTSLILEKIANLVEQLAGSESGSGGGSGSSGVGGNGGGTGVSGVGGNGGGTGVSGVGGNGGGTGVSGVGGNSGGTGVSGVGGNSGGTGVSGVGGNGGGPEGLRSINLHSAGHPTKQVYQDDEGNLYNKWGKQLGKAHANGSITFNSAKQAEDAMGSGAFTAAAIGGQVKPGRADSVTVSGKAVALTAGNLQPSSAMPFAG